MLHGAEVYTNQAEITSRARSRRTIRFMPHRSSRTIQRIPIPVAAFFSIRLNRLQHANQIPALKEILILGLFIDI